MEFFTKAESLDSVVTKIYKNCDSKRTDWVRISQLVEILKPLLENQEEFDLLKYKLNSGKKNPRITCNNFLKIMKEWIAEVNKQRGVSSSGTRSTGSSKVDIANAIAQTQYEKVVFELKQTKEKFEQQVKLDQNSERQNYIEEISKLTKEELQEKLLTQFDENVKLNEAIRFFEYKQYTLLKQVDELTTSQTQMEEKCTGWLDGYLFFSNCVEVKKSEIANLSKNLNDMSYALEEKNGLIKEYEKELKSLNNKAQARWKKAKDRNLIKTSSLFEEFNEVVQPSDNNMKKIIDKSRDEITELCKDISNRFVPLKMGNSSRLNRPLIDQIEELKYLMENYVFANNSADRDTFKIYKKHCQCLEKQIESLKKDNEMIQEENKAKIQDLIDSWQTHFNKHFDKDLKQFQIEYMDLAKENENLKKENDKLILRLDEKGIVINQITQKNKELIIYKRDYEDKQQEAHTSFRRYKEAEQQYKILKEDYENLEDELNSKNYEIERLQNEINDINCSIEHNNEKLANLTNEMFASFENKYDTSAHIQNLKAEVSSSKRFFAKIFQLRARVDLLVALMKLCIQDYELMKNVEGEKGIDVKSERDDLFMEHFGLPRDIFKRCNHREVEKMINIITSTVYLTLNDTKDQYNIRQEMYYRKIQQYNDSLDQLLGYILNHITIAYEFKIVSSHLQLLKDLVVEVGKNGEEFGEVDYKLRNLDMWNTVINHVEGLGRHVNATNNETSTTTQNYYC